MFTITGTTVGDSFFKGALEKSRKSALNSKDGTMKYNGVKYYFKFDLYHSHYNVRSEDESFNMDFNVRGLANVKKELKEWLDN